MVAEILATVGLVGNIVQFIDFSSKLFSTASAIRNSASGKPQRLQNVEEVANHIKQWCRGVRDLRNDLTREGTLHKRSLVDLAVKCEAVAAEILSTLDDWKAKNPKSKWDSFKTALATSWKESQIAEMQSRLEFCRKQLSLELSRLQSDDFTQLYSLLKDLEQANKRLGANLSNQIEDMQENLKHAIDTLHRHLANVDLGRATVLPAQRAGGSDAPGTETSKNEPTIIETPAQKKAADILTDCPSAMTDYGISLLLLDSLDYEQRRSRYSNIQDAHPRTLQWVFPTKFDSWLRSDSSIFWVSGKPGSGKSTIMKHLARSSETRAALSFQSGLHAPIIADYYFWVNGTSLQRSQEGLFRAILYDIICQNPRSMESLFPHAWNAARKELDVGKVFHLRRFNYQWTLPVLLCAFQNLSAKVYIGRRLCIFVDGLDEFQGNHEELIASIRNLTMHNIKLCVASRPWNIFEEAFGVEPEQKIYVQDFNKLDMERYVSEMLIKQPNFGMIEHKKAQSIIEEIVEKSQGVFLWVYLVVRSLSEGLRNRDGVSLLQKRLREFPSDLDPFFRQIFLSLDEIYRPHLSHMFQVSLRAASPIPVLAFWFLDELEDRNLDLDTMSVDSRSKLAHSEIEDIMTTRINGRCKGLLEVKYSHVDFLHRTVKDFFETRDMHDMLLEWQREDFNVDLTLCNVLLAEYISQNHPTGIRHYFHMIFTAMERYENETGCSANEYVKVFERTFLERLQDLNDFGKIDIWNTLFVAESPYGLNKYIRGKLSSDFLERRYDVVTEIQNGYGPHASEVRKSLIRRVKKRFKRIQ